MGFFEGFLQTQADNLTYAVFFGALIIFGVLEQMMQMANAPTRRLARWPVNIALTVANIAIMGALPITAIMAANYCQSVGIGLFQQFNAPFVLVLAGGFFARSLISWIIHYLFHHISFLWQIHRIHHCDTNLDISTTVRFHPLEIIISLPLVVGMVVLLGIPPSVVILFELFDAALAVFSHANIKLPRRLESILSRIVITPDLHRIHHSPNESETNSNYGATLVVWDFVFGTLRRKNLAALQAQDIGLHEFKGKRANSLLFLLTLPFGRNMSHDDNHLTDNHDSAIKRAKPK